MSPAKSARNADNDRAAPDGCSALDLGAERAIGTGAERRDGSTPLAAQDTDRGARPGTRQDIAKDGTTDSGTGATFGPADDRPADSGGGRPAGSDDGAADSSAAPSQRVRRPRIAVLLGVAAFAYALDLVTKLVVVAKLEGEAPIDVIGDWLQFRGTRNPGAAFGMGQAYTIVFTLIATAVIVVILRLARKLYSLPWGIALGLLLGGALGNLTDRLLRSPGFLRGHVVDFIAPKHFAVFNLADSAIVVGGCLIVLLSFLGLQPDGTREGDEPEDADESERADAADRAEPADPADPSEGAESGDPRGDDRRDQGEKTD